MRRPVLQLVPPGALGPGERRVDRAGLTLDDALVERILGVAMGTWRAPQPLGIRLVVGEDQLG